MLPVIAIVGRPNVGKSTLFNQFTRSRDAIVADLPGLTRDRLYGEGSWSDRDFIVIDTGGIGEEELELDAMMTHQAKLAMTEADIILFLVDIRGGITAADRTITQLLRQTKKKVVLVANKCDGVDVDSNLSECFELGLGMPIPIAASHGRGVQPLLEHILQDYPQNEEILEDPDEGIKFAIIGRPNVGKSTLVNRILGEERVVVFDQPGTTRDSISISFTHHNKAFTIIDTAGIRKKGKVNQGVEKFSVVKTLQAMRMCQVVVMVVDATEGITDQDLHLLGYCIDAGKAIVIGINKWDGLPEEQRQKVQRDIDRRLEFARFADHYFISALHGTGVGNLFPAIEKAYATSIRILATPEVNQVLNDAIARHNPPLVRGRRIKLRYAHMGGHNPPVIVIHGNQTEEIPDSYKRYLIKTFREHFQLAGTPIKLVFKSTDNPFKHIRNKLTPRQLRSRKRVMKYAKK